MSSAPADTRRETAGMESLVGPVLAASGAAVGIIVAVVVVLVFAFIFLSSAIKVVTEYERSVFFRLGPRSPRGQGPGCDLPIP